MKLLEAQMSIQYIAVSNKIQCTYVARPAGIAEAVSLAD